MVVAATGVFAAVLLGRGDCDCEAGCGASGCAGNDCAGNDCGGNGKLFGAGATCPNA